MNCARALNQYTAVAASGYSYDASGNLTNGGIRNYVYDAENRLVSVQNGPAFVYDPLGRLVEVSQAAYLTRFLYDGDALVAEYNSGGALTQRYVHGPNAAADDPLVDYAGATLASRRFLETDHQGSVIRIGDNAGATTATNRYDEYGVPAATNVGRFGYTGQQFMGELSLTGQAHAFYYYKARIYRADIGRFLQVDPVGYENQINLYVYVANDPMNMADPSGLSPEIDEYVQTNGEVFVVRTESETKEITGRVYKQFERTDDGTIAKLATTSDGQMNNLLDLSGQEPGRPTVFLRSGERSEAENKALGGVADSSHLPQNGGEAVDFSIENYNGEQAADAAERLGRWDTVNEYGTGAHVDNSGQDRKSGPGRYKNWDYQRPQQPLKPKT